MERHELAELHYITPINNVPSILQHGILSHVRAAQVRHSTVAMDEIQDLRSQVVVHGGRRLHEYVNLYVCGRNPMLYKRLADVANLCVVPVSPSVLDLPGVVIADCNASSKYVRFAAGPVGLGIVDRALTFADDWTDNDQIQYFRKKAAKCAEVLIPDCVEAKYLLGAYVVREDVQQKLQAVAPGLAVQVNAHLFFA
jgi:hypothetical protein